MKPIDLKTYAAEIYDFPLGETTVLDVAAVYAEPSMRSVGSQASRIAKQREDLTTNMLKLLLINKAWNLFASKLPVRSGCELPSLAFATGLFHSKESF
ncbi:MAG: hypothetical protein AAFU71_06830 [Cyanobacteria bacterium J06632_22]